MWQTHPSAPPTAPPSDGGTPVARKPRRGAGMSEDFALLLVEMLLAMYEGRMTEEVQRTAKTSTPTWVEEFLSTALGPMSSP
jgi:hypothetical protein